jgi:hypothetical protein
MVFSVDGRMDLLSCSAMTREVMGVPIQRRTAGRKSRESTQKLAKENLEGFLFPFASFA